MPTSVVTGGAGFLGSHLCDALLECGHRVICVLAVVLDVVQRAGLEVVGKRARFLLASTSEVYGDPLVHPQPETYWGNVNPIGPRGVYLLRDERRLTDEGWQSGLLTAGGLKKPSFAAFQRLR